MVDRYFETIVERNIKSYYSLTLWKKLQLFEILRYLFEIKGYFVFIRGEENTIYICVFLYWANSTNFPRLFYT